GGTARRTKMRERRHEIRVDIRIDLSAGARHVADEHHRIAAAESPAPRNLVTEVAADFRRHGKMISIVWVRERGLGQNSAWYRDGTKSGAAIGKRALVGPAQADFDVPAQDDSPPGCLSIYTELKQVEVIDGFKAIEHGCRLRSHDSRTRAEIKEK